MLPAQVNFECYKGDTFSKTITLYADANVTYKGLWSSVVNYKVNDVVKKSDGVLYKCTAAHKGYEPPNVSYWSTLTPLNLSTATIEGKIKISLDDTTAVQAFTVALVTDGSDGKFTLSLLHTVTDDFTFKEATYDVEILIGSTKKKYLYGKFLVRKENTV